MADRAFCSLAQWLDREHERHVSLLAVKDVVGSALLTDAVSACCRLEALLGRKEVAMALPPIGHGAMYDVESLAMDNRLDLM